MPVTSDVNLRRAIEDLAKKLDCPTTNDDKILAVHRLPVKKESGTAVVLMKFSSVGLRVRRLCLRDHLRSLRNSVSKSRLFFQQKSKAHEQGALSEKKRLVGKERNSHYAWVRD